MDGRYRVALLIESSRAYGRGLLRGIARYARTHGPWSLFHQERKIGDDAPNWLQKWSGDGIIARIENPRLLGTLREMKLPCVDLRGLHEVAGIPILHTDDREVTRLAIEHLRDRGFGHLGYCGFEGTDYSAIRRGFFQQALREAGLEPSIYEGPRPPRGDTTAIEAEGLLYEDDVAAWVKSLRKPAGVMACNDIRAVQLLSACRDHGLAVPDEVAVIGVDNDELLCELCDPPLSSVEPDTEKIGYEAAAVLERMMRGQVPAAEKTFIQPRGVVTRLSTDVLAMEDRQIAAALRFIRENACKPIGIEDVLRQVPISRSTLERRFQAILGRSPKEEVLRVRLGRVKQLLRDTNYTLPKIAGLAGFTHHEYMSALFRKKTGQTPGQFRASQIGG